MAASFSITAASPPGTLKRRERVFAVTQSDATVLMDVAGGRYFTLNDVAGRIWELLTTPRTTAELITELAAEYEVPTDRLALDVAALTGRLVELSLLVREP